MIIRTADVEKDEAQLLFMARDFISRMDNTEYLPDDDVFEKYAKMLVASDTVEIVVAEERGVVVAGLGIALSPFLWNPEMLQGEELFWWAAPDAPRTAAIRVFKETINRIKRSPFRGRTIACFKRLTSSPKSVASLYERMGLREVETNYVGVF